MEFIPTKKSIHKIVAVAFAFVLVFSLSVHAVETEHDHPGHTAQDQSHEEQNAASLEVYMHSSDKKLFMLAIVFFLFLGANIVQSIPMPFGHSLLAFMRDLFYKARLRQVPATQVFGYLLRLFCRGLLHPKTY